MLASYARLFEIGEARVRAAIAEWADGRYEAERFVDDDGIAGKAGAHPRGRRETRRPAAFRFLRLGRSDPGAGQHPPAAGAGGLRLCADLADRSAHVCVERAAARFQHHRARRQRAQSALSGAGQHLQSDRACAGRCAVRRARPDRARKGARRRQRQPLDHHRRAQHLYRQGLRAIRDHRRRRRRARHQGRRVRHHRQPEQRQDRADRDHRERVSDPRRCASSSFAIPAAPDNIAAGSASAANISISPTRASRSAR